MTEKRKSQYLQYLPAIYQEDSFLGEFLLPFEEVLAGFGELLSAIDHTFAPALTDPDFLPWLATWVALVLDEEWPEAKRRRLIGEAVRLYQKRGTVDGLKDYLEIYTGLVPDIREWHWPGGMQIGIASQIGGTLPEDAPLTRIERTTRNEPAHYDYYVVDTVDDEGFPMQVYYRTDKVIPPLDIGDNFVKIDYLPPDSDEIAHKTHQPATVTRRDGLLDNSYILEIETETGVKTVEYQGDTFFIDEVAGEQPYRFIVDVRVPLEEVEQVKLDKVRAIIDLEKPAHTMYYLKLTPLASEHILHVMQIGIRSTIGVDTTIG